MPTDDITVTSLPALRVAELRATAASYEPPSVGPVIRPLYEELAQHLTKAEVAITGPAIAYYEGAGDDGSVIVHAAFPVEAALDGDHDFAVVDLPAVDKAARIIHHGSMDDVLPTAHALARWIEANGYGSSGFAREVYVQSTPDGCDTLVTELYEPIWVMS